MKRPQKDRIGNLHHHTHPSHLPQLLHSIPPPPRPHLMRPQTQRPQPPLLLRIPTRVRRRGARDRLPPTATPRPLRSTPPLFHTSHTLASRRATRRHTNTHPAPPPRPRSRLRKAKITLPPLPPLPSTLPHLPNALPPKRSQRRTIPPHLLLPPLPHPNLPHHHPNLPLIPHRLAFKPPPHLSYTRLTPTNPTFSGCCSPAEDGAIRPAHAAGPLRFKPNESMSTQRADACSTRSMEEGLMQTPLRRHLLPPPLRSRARTLLPLIRVLYNLRREVRVLR